jgi:hypothetical protein
MKLRNVIWIAITLAGAAAGAGGTRFLASAPDIYQVADLPLFDLVLAIPCFLLMAWAAVATLGRYSLVLFYGAIALGVYGSSYGLFELVFHFFNHRPALSSIALLLLGSVILTSCYIANRLFSGRLREA